MRSEEQKKLFNLPLWKFREMDLHSPEWMSLSSSPPDTTKNMSDESAEAPAPVPNPSEAPAVPIPSPGEAPAMPSELVDVKKEERPINLRVQDQQGGQVHFKVKFSTPMRKIFDMYAQKRGVAVNVLRFMLDGRRVRPEDTAATLGLEDDDQIDCLLEQIGG